MPRNAAPPVNLCALCREPVLRSTSPGGLILEKVELWPGISETVPLCPPCYGCVQPVKPPVLIPWA